MKKKSPSFHQDHWSTNWLKYTVWQKVITPFMKLLSVFTDLCFKRVSFLLVTSQFNPRFDFFSFFKNYLLLILKAQPVVVYTRPVNLHPDVWFIRSTWYFLGSGTFKSIKLHQIYFFSACNLQVKREEARLPLFFLNNKKKLALFFAPYFFQVANQPMFSHLE